MQNYIHNTLSWAIGGFSKLWWCYKLLYKSNTDKDGNAIFFYKLVQGICPNSLAFNTAEMAGFSQKILSRAVQKSIDFQKKSEKFKQKSIERKNKLAVYNLFMERIEKKEVLNMEDIKYFLLLKKNIIW